MTPAQHNIPVNVLYPSVYLKHLMFAVFWISIELYPLNVLKGVFRCPKLNNVYLEFSPPTLLLICIKYIDSLRAVKTIHRLEQHGGEILSDCGTTLSVKTTALFAHVQLSLLRNNSSNTSTTICHYLACLHIDQLITLLGGEKNSQYSYWSESLNRLRLSKFCLPQSGFRMLLKGYLRRKTSRTTVECVCSVAGFEQCLETHKIELM